jgi:hypothetical protein
VPHQLSPELLAELGNRSAVAQRKKDAAQVQKIDSGIAAQTRVVSMQASEWVALQDFARGHRLMSETDASILAMVTGRKPGFPTEAQCKRLLTLLDRATELGFEAN